MITTTACRASVSAVIPPGTVGSHGPLNNPGNLIVGRTVPNNGSFGGYLEDVRIYNVALTDDQIAIIAAGGP